MEAITVIEYATLSIVVIYLSALFIIWIYELKKNSLYREMLGQIKLLESLNICAALFHIKLYKIKEDNKKRCEILENAQRFIYAKLLFMVRHDETNKKSFNV